MGIFGNTLAGWTSQASCSRDATRGSLCAAPRQQSRLHLLSGGWIRTSDRPIFHFLCKGKASKPGRRHGYRERLREYRLPLKSRFESPLHCPVLISRALRRAVAENGTVTFQRLSHGDTHQGRARAETQIHIRVSVCLHGGGVLAARGRRPIVADICGYRCCTLRQR